MNKLTYDETMAGSGRIFALGRFERDARTPREAAERAWYPGHDLTVDELEALIIRQRDEALAALDAEQPKLLAA